MKLYRKSQRTQLRSHRAATKLLKSGVCGSLFFHAWFATLNAMKNIIQVHIYKIDQYFVAECLDLPVVTQGKTLDELAQNLKEAIALQLEGEDPADFGLIKDPSVLVSFEIEPAYA